GADDTNELPRWMHGLVLGQRALIQLRAGDPPAAMKDFDGAARLLTEHHPEDLCKVLLNRGVLALQQRHPERAGDDFTRCAAIANRHGLAILAAKAAYNLGYLAMLAGDLPRALREMDAATPMLNALSPAMLGVYHTDHAQVMLGAGLLREADEDLDVAVTLFRQTGDRHNQADAELARAHVAL